MKKLRFLDKFKIFELNKSKVESHIEIFLKFFTVEVFAGLIIVLVSYFWLNFIGGESNITNFKYFLRANLHESDSTGIVIITLNDEHYKSLRSDSRYQDELKDVHKYTFPRKYLQPLIEMVEKAHPKLVAVDILLDVNSTNPEIDNQLANTLSNYDNIVLCSDISAWHDQEIKPLSQYWSQSQHVVGHARLNELDQKYQFIRHLVHLSNNEIVPSFSFAAYMRLNQINNDFRIRKAIKDSLETTVRSLNLPFSGQELFQPQFISFSNLRYDDFDSENGFGFTRYESQMIVDGKIPDEWLRGRIVFIGATYEESQDFGYTPLHKQDRQKNNLMNGNPIPGVFVHASILSELISKNFIQKLKFKEIAFVIFVLIILILLLFKFLKLFFAVFTSFLLIFIFWIGNIYIFVADNSYYMPMANPTILLFFVILFLVFLSFYKKESAVDYIHKIWAPFVPSGRLKAIIEESKKGSIELGAVGKAEIITVIFVKFVGVDNIIPDSSDDHGFKQNYLDQIEVLDQLINVLQSEIVFVKRFEGAAERFLGNGAFFYFGIPVGNKDEEEASRALNCAWELNQKFESLKSRIPKLQRYFPGLKLQICIHTGGIIVGAVRNLEQHIEPTLITKIFEEIYGFLSCMSNNGKQANIIISQRTYQYVKNLIEAEEIKFDRNSFSLFKLYELKEMKQVILGTDSSIKEHLGNRKL